MINKNKYYLLFSFLITTSVFSKNDATYEINLQNKQRNLEHISREERNIEGKKKQYNNTIENISDDIVNEDAFSVILKKLIVDKDGESIDISSNQFVKSYLGKDIGKTEIFEIIKQLSNYLVLKGYTTSSVTIVPGNLNEGALKLKINWGRISRVTINGKEPQGFNDKSLAWQLYPFAKNKIFNIHDVDQIVENGNNSGKTVKIDIIPDAIDGFSTINVVVSTNDAKHYSLAFDNSGSGTSNSSGLYRYTLSASYDDLLLGSDSLRLSAYTRHIYNDGGGYNYFGSMGYSFPIGSSNFSFSVNKSDTGSTINVPGQSYDNKSSQLVYNSTFSNVIYRSQKSKITGVLELNRRHPKNYFDHLLIEVSSNPYTDLSGGLQFSTIIQDYSLYADLKYNNGTEWLNGQKAGTDSDLHMVNMQRWLSNLSLAKDFTVLNRKINFNSRASAQYSKDTLFDIYRMSMGDEFSVRGFRGSNFSGDSGVTLTNTLKTSVYSSSSLLLNSFVGGDIGYVTKNKSYSNTISGMATGIDGSFYDLSGAFTLGVPVTYKKSGGVSKVDPVVMYFNLSYRF